MALLPNLELDEIVTGKNKARCAIWYNCTIRLECANDNYYFDSFIHAPFEMQIGVYLAYYDSLGLHVNAIRLHDHDGGYYWHGMAVRFIDDISGNRTEAYREAFRNADEIANADISKKETT